MHFDNYQIALSFDITNSSEVMQTRRGTLRDPNNQRVSLACAVRCGSAINYYKLMWLSPPLLIGMIIKLGSARGTYATLPKIIRTETNRRSSMVVFTRPKCLLLYPAATHMHTHTYICKAAPLFLIRYVFTYVYIMWFSIWFFNEALYQLNR